MKLKAYVAALLLVAGHSPADAQSWFSRNLIDPNDGSLDASEWLGKGGFLPVPLIITEPAVDNGAGVALAFIDADEETDEPPNISALAAALTGNDSKIYAGFHEGYYLNDRLRFSAVAAKTDLNLNFFVGDSDRPFGYKLDGGFARMTARGRLGRSNWFAGGSLTYADTEVVFQGAGILPPGLPALGFQTTLASFGAILDFESLDNTLSPTSGISARIEADFQSEGLGSDYDFTSYRASYQGFTNRFDDWVLGLKVEGNAVTGDAPFFALPYISLRGIPALRYQGEQTIAAEFEAMYSLSDRYRLLAFVGAGEAFSDDSVRGVSEGTKAVYGVGARYLIARRFGLLMGLDVARGPEDTVVYLQFGKAWRRF